MVTRKSAVIALTLFLLFTAAAHAAPPGKCSLATLHGNYGFFGEGPATLAGDPTMKLVIAGIMRFDGHGNLTGESIGNLEGWGAGGTGAFAGTYAVTPDCTYSGEHTGGGETLHFVGSITGEGMLQEMRFVVTDPGWVALGRVRRISPAGCSQATLSGSYALFGEGAVMLYVPPAPIAHVGILNYDGAGNFAGRDTIMLGGVKIEPEDTFVGTYTVTPECMISVEITSAAVGVIHEVGWIVGEGKSTEVRLIGTDPGFLFVEATRKQ